MSDFESKIDINIDAGQALAAIKTLQRQISDFHTSLAKGSATANLKSLQMQQTLIDTINATGQYSAQMKTVASSTQTFTTALEKNKLSMAQYFRYAGGASKSFGRFFKSEMDTIQKVAIERVKDLQTQYIKMGRDANGAIRSIAVRPLALDMENLATKTQIAAQKQQLLNQLLKQGSTNLLNFGKNTQWAGRQLMVGFTIPLGILGTTAAKTFMQMEEQAIKFKRVYGDTFTATKETDAMLKQVQALASEFTKYGVTVEKTMEQAAKAAATGKMGADLLAQVSEATRLSVLGNVEQAQALETTISLTNAFGTAADQLRGKINFLNAVENQTVTSIEDLTIAIPKAAPVIQQLGGDVEDLTFFLTAMREGGINASEGANALKSGLASLINPTKKASDFLQSFGININKIVEGNKGNVQGLVVDFAKALDTLDPLNRARAIEQLFGKFQFSRLSTLFQNVIKDGSQAAKVLELTKQSSAELGILAQRELNRISASPMYKFQKAIADFKKELAPVGEEFLKAVTPIIQFGTDILKAFNNLDGGVKQFIVNATGLIAGIGPVFLMTFGLLANGVANIIKGFTFVKTVFNKASTASTILGETTDYMTQQQLEAAAVAASLEQVHNKLTQAFTVEKGAIDALTSSYKKAISAQVAFSGASAGSKTKVAPKKYANGIFSVPGPKGAGDIIPAMLSPGEAVIPAKPAEKYRGFIKGMIAGNIPGFSEGTDRIEKIIADFKRRSRSAPDAISNQTKNMDWETFKDEEAAMLEEVEKEIKREAKTESQARDLRNKYIGKDAAHTGRRVKQVSIGDRLVDQKVFASDVITPDARGFNQAFADLIEKRVNQKESGKYKSGSWIGDLLNDKKRVSELAKSVGMKEADLRRELKNFDPMRPGGAQYPTTRNAWKAFEAVAIGSDTTPGRIARAGLRVRNENYGRAGTREAALKAGKLKYDPALDAKAAEQQENRRKNSDRRARELQAKEAKAKKRNTAAVNKNTDAVKKDTAAVEEQTKTRKKATKTQSKVNATPAITTKEQLGNGITRTVNEKGQEKYYQKGRRGSISATEARNILAGSGAAASPKGRLKGILTGLPGKLGIAGLATMGVGAVTGNQQVSSLADQLFTAAMLSSFVPQGTMGKLGKKFAPMKNKIMGSKAMQGLKSTFSGTIERFGAAKGVASGAKLAMTESLAAKGLMKSLPMLALQVGKVALSFARVLNPIGWVALGLEGLHYVLTTEQRKQDELSRAITETLTITKDRLDKINEFFGTDAKLSGIRAATVAGAGQTEEQATLAEQFRQSDQFTATYKPQAEKLKGVSDQQFKITMQSLALDLYGQGVGEEQVQIIIDAIKKEAQKTDLIINFKDFKLDTEEGRANLASSLKTLTDSAISDFTGQRMWWGRLFESDKIKEISSQMAGFISGISQSFEKGEISAEQFAQSFEKIRQAIYSVNVANPSSGMILLNQTLRDVNPEIANASSLIADQATQLGVLEAAMKGVALSQQLLADLSVGNAAAKQYLKDANAFEDQKNADLRKQEKVISNITAQQKNLQNQEQDINKAYDDRIKALERINQLQEQMAKQKQNQLDLADALSRGDVFAAAQAAQKIRADQASLALEQQKNALEDEKAKKVDSINDQQDKLDGALSEAQSKLRDIQKSQMDAYISAVNTPTFEKLYKDAAPLFILMRPDLWFADEGTKQAAFAQYLQGQAQAAKGNKSTGRPWVYNDNAKPVNGLGGNMSTEGAKTTKANGGHITGPGSGTSDSIPAMLSNGEYVIRANAVKALGVDTLDKLNYADRAKFADGGLVDPNNPMSILSAGLNHVMDGIYQNLFGGWMNNLRHGSPTMPTAEDALIMGLNSAPIPGFKGAKAGVTKLISKFKKPSVLHTPAFKKFTDNAYVNFMRTNPRIAVRMNSDKFIEALNRGDTSYKNRYELKPEMLGEFNANEASQRLKIEENVFGIPKDAPGSARPIYGIASDTGIPWGIRGKEPSDSSFAKYFVRNKTNAMTKSLERYGDISLLLKKKVNKRSTFTIGDSYSAKNFANASPSIPAKFGTLSRSKILNSKTDTRLPEFQFVEAQIFGGLPFKDIKKILVQDPRMAKIIERELSDAGYKIPVGMPKVNLLGRIIEKLYKNKTYIHEGKDTGLPLFYSSKIGSYAKGGKVDKKKKSWEENTLDWFSGLGKSIAELPGIKQFGEYYMKENDFGSGVLRALFGTLALPVNLIGGAVNSALKATALGQKGNISGMLAELYGTNAITNALASSYSGVLDPKLTQSSQFDAAAQTVIDNKMFGADTKAGIARAKLIGGAFNFIGDPTMYLGIGALGKVASAAKLAGKAKYASAIKYTGVGTNKELAKIISSTYTRKNVRVGDAIYPTYSVAGSKSSFAFQGLGEELPGVLSATGIKTVPTTPEGLLQAAIELNPQDKGLQTMLKNFQENKIGQSELALLDDISASVSINKKGVPTKVERTDGFALLLSSLAGNKAAKVITEFKTQKLKDIVAENASMHQSNVLSQIKKSEPLLGTQIATPSSIPFIRSLRGPLEFDKNGNALIYPASKYRDDFARTSVHGTFEYPVQSHQGGKWDISETKLITPFSEVLKNNGLPRSMDAADVWYLLNPGQPLVFPKNTYSLLHTFKDDAEYAAELTRRGLIQPGQTLPIITTDPATKDVLRLLKSSANDYTDAQQELLWNQYKKQILPEYSIESTLENIGVQLAKEQVGINTPLSTLDASQHLSNSARYNELQRLGNALGVPGGATSHSLSMERGIERAHKEWGTYRTMESQSKLAADRLEMLRTASRLGHFKTQKLTPVVADRVAFKKSILDTMNEEGNFANGGLVNIPKFKNGGMFRTGYAGGGLAMLHDKEFVMNAGAVKDYGVNNLKAMNNGTYNSGSVYNSYGVNISVGGSNSNANDIARTVIREIKRLDSQNIRSTKV